MPLSLEQIKLIKQLREQTKISIAKCQQALEATEYQPDKAIAYIETYMRDQVVYRESKSTDEGGLFAYNTGKKMTLIELKTETDFVSKQQGFKDLGNNIAKTIHELHINVGQEISSDISDIIDRMTKQAMLAFGENIIWTRYIQCEGPITNYYIHQGKVASLVALERGSAEIARQIAIHLVAKESIAINKDDLDPIYFEQIADDCRKIHGNKTADILTRIIHGYQEKFIKNNCLIHQPFYADETITVAQYLEANNSIISHFLKWILQ